MLWYMMLPLQPKTTPDTANETKRNHQKKEGRKQGRESQQANNKCPSHSHRSQGANARSLKHHSLMQDTVIVGR